jgi:hypothetical protein
MMGPVVKNSTVLFNTGGTFAKQAFGINANGLKIKMETVYRIKFELQ